jgi:phosphoribosylanthranilate isomerase
MFVKICGTTSEEDALLAVAMGADALGFVFAPSPRQIATSLAADIAKRLPPEILTVGVFRNEAPDRVVEIVNRAGLRGAQLHGDETADQTKWVRRRVPFVIKGFPAGDPAVRHAGDYGADVVLLDSARPGSGQVFDWSLAEAPSRTRLMLAGGLTPDNVTDAIEQVRPWGVDVVTGVEAEPGRKDPRKVRAFIANARAAARRFVPEHAEPPDDDRSAPYDWQQEEYR